MSKIYVLIGAPTFGKSKLARKMHEEDHNKVIVNRDDIRDARGTYWLPDQEDYISEIEEFEVRAAINRGLSPIIDATNLNPKTLDKWDRLSVELGCDLEKIYLPYISFEEALRRDTERGKNGGRSVGLKTLSRFYKQYYPDKYFAEIGVDKCPSTEPDRNKTPAVIFDLDRTLMYRNGRDIYDYESASTDSIDPRAQLLIEHLINIGFEVFINTGREITDKSLESIYKSMKINPIKKLDGIYYPYQIYGRKPGDRRKSCVLKEQNLEEILKKDYEILAAFDDDESCVEMYRNHGIFACKVN